jgi:multiple sugar transport system substrate-binding protein
MATRRGVTPRSVRSGGMSRREFLRVGGVSVAGVVLLPACAGFGGGGDEGGGETVFSFGPDDSGTLKEVVKRFNAQSDFEATYREMPADTGQYFDKLRTEFQAGGGINDVIGGDVIWPAQFGSNGWIQDLSDRFPEEERAQFLEGPIESNTLEGKIYGVPWFTDAGMFYYRADLLEKAGFSEPPKTYEEMVEMAKKVQTDQGIKYGFVFQGSNYEGGVVNGMEYIWNAGGNVLDPEDPSQVVIDSPEAAAGLAAERSFVDEGITPDAVVNYTELESHTAFVNGDSVFLRNWPYVFGIIEDPKQSKIKFDQVGVTPLPVESEGLDSTSSLGGWNMFINSETDDADAAYELIQFFVSKDIQKYRALTGGFLPTLSELYEDPEIIDKVPVVKLGGEIIGNTSARPVSPYYSDMSLEMADVFNSNLKGDITAEEAVATLQTSLEEIIEAGEG